jgi:hypothetical protein
MATAVSPIKDSKTFGGATKEPHQVAGVYFYSLMDCLVDLAFMISCDFFERPHMYTNLAISGGAGGSVAGEIARLHARTGNDEQFLASTQRRQVYIGLFGPGLGYRSDDSGDFGRLRNELINASAAFAERVYDTGVEMLLERVRAAHRPFHEYLAGLLGDSLRWSRDNALAGLAENVAYPILRNPGVAAVFGVATVPVAEWPFTLDANADKLVEAVDRQLKSKIENGPNGNTAASPLTRARISNLQRAALRGAEALVAVVDFDERGSKADLLSLITSCYVWGSSLASLSRPVPNP